MQRSVHAPVLQAPVVNEITHKIILHESVSLPRLFAQTTSFWRSQSYLILFKQLVSEIEHKKDQQSLEDPRQETIKNLLSDLYLNYGLLMKEEASSLLPAWIKCLNGYRQSSSPDYINRLLASGILAIIDRFRCRWNARSQEESKQKESRQTQLNESQFSRSQLSKSQLSASPSSQVEYDFMAALYLCAMRLPQLANSVLAVWAQAKGDQALYNACLHKHNLNELLQNSSISRNISVNDAVLIIKPFITSYEQTQYFPPLIQLVNTTKDLRKNNFCHIIHALLKLIPANNVFWANPSESLPGLMFNLRVADTIEAKEEIVDILATIQLRLIDKNFLENYYKTCTSLWGVSNLFSDAIKEAVNQALKTEAEIVKHLEKNYYSSIQENSQSNLFLSRMTKYLNKLKDEKNIIAAIDIMLPALIFRMENNNYNQVYLLKKAIENLLLKINSMEFLNGYLDKLYTNPILSIRQSGFPLDIIASLALVCDLPRLDETTLLFHLKALFEFYENKTYSSLACNMMSNLCQRIQSEQEIKKWLDYFYARVVSFYNETQWFADQKNFMYFECYLILLSKSNRENELNVYLKELFSLLTGNCLYSSYISGDIMNLFCKLIPKIKSKEIFATWFNNIFPRSVCDDTTSLLFSIRKDNIQGSIAVIANGFTKESKSGFFSIYTEGISCLLAKASHAEMKKIMAILFEANVKDASMPIRENVRRCMEGKEVLVEEKVQRLGC